MIIPAPTDPVLRITDNVIADAALELDPLNLSGVFLALEVLEQLRLTSTLRGRPVVMRGGNN